MIEYLGGSWLLSLARGIFMVILGVVNVSFMYPKSQIRPPSHFRASLFVFSFINFLMHLVQIHSCEKHGLLTFSAAFLLVATWSPRQDNTHEPSNTVTPFHFHLPGT